MTADTHARDRIGDPTPQRDEYASLRKTLGEVTSVPVKPMAQEVSAHAWLTRWIKR